MLWEIFLLCTRDKLDLLKDFSRHKTFFFFFFFGWCCCSWVPLGFVQLSCLLSAGCVFSESSVSADLTSLVRICSPSVIKSHVPGGPDERWVSAKLFLRLYQSVLPTYWWPYLDMTPTAELSMHLTMQFFTLWCCSCGQIWPKKIFYFS